MSANPEHHPQDCHQPGFFMQGTPSAKAYPSQAEMTIAKYKESTQFKERVKLHCWDCGGDHSWMRRGVITCPCSTEPQVLEKRKGQL
jgi:hypothetical protein